MRICLNYSPRDVVDNIHRMMEGEEPLPMTPWYRGFTGSIVQMDKDKFKVCGTVEKTSDTTVEITELPIKTWTQSYKEMLESWMTGDQEKKVKPIIQVTTTTAFPRSMN
jgi:DNA topoisomerase-2